MEGRFAKRPYSKNEYLQIIPKFSNASKATLAQNHGMDAFALNPPNWTDTAFHATEFCCPTCHALSTEAEQVWINRRSPVRTEDHRRKWQEFYQCSCGTVWWAWSSDRPPTTLKQPDTTELPGDWMF